MTDQEQKPAVKLNVNDPELDPYEIEFLPKFLEGRGNRAPFVNKHGVVIGDHEYESPHSPLSQWNVDTDPAIMAGEEWVHPFKDVGFLTAENRDIFEKGLPPQGGIFTHSDKNAAYGVNDPDDSSDLFEKEQPE